MTVHPGRFSAASACYSGDLAPGEATDVCAAGAAAAGNLLADRGVPEAMLAIFTERAADSLGDRLLAALGAGLAAGGEVSPVRSSGMVIAGSAPWPITDLRVARCIRRSSGTDSRTALIAGRASRTR